LLLGELRTEDIGESEDVFLRAEVESHTRDNALIEQMASQLRSDDSVSKVEWAEASLEPE
jgi:hypothetical protein